MTAPVSRSPAEALAARLASELGGGAHGALDLALGKLAPVERAALAFAWRDFWARPTQVIPDGPWRSYGTMAGRGYGKTRKDAEWVTAEIAAGRAGRVALVDKSNADTRGIMVEGKSGLVAVAPPWFQPVYMPGNGYLEYPNGARAYLYSAEAPEHFRGPEHHIVWASELGSWPKETWEAAWYNLRMGLRLGYAKLVWDSTPRTVPLIRLLLERHRKHPATHLIVRGSTLENRANLPGHFIEEMVAEYGGTRLGLQEIEGQFLEDEDGQMFTQRMIQEARRRAPDVYLEKALAIDPAITSRKGSDETGIVVGGRGTDDQVYVVADLSGKHSPERWANLAIDAALRHGVNAIVYEDPRRRPGPREHPRSGARAARGGQAHAAAAAADRRAREGRQARASPAGGDALRAGEGLARRRRRPGAAREADARPGLVEHESGPRGCARAPRAAPREAVGPRGPAGRLRRRDGPGARGIAHDGSTRPRRRRDRRGRRVARGHGARRAVVTNLPACTTYRLV